MKNTKNTTRSNRKAVETEAESTPINLFPGLVQAWLN